MKEKKKYDEKKVVSWKSCNLSWKVLQHWSWSVLVWFDIPRQFVGWQVATSSAANCWL